ncbi:MAG: class I SAM-dependent methyltransferase, partial [Bacillati bacterium ANGP1]
IIIQFVLAGLRIKELPIPTYYGDEICRVNGIRYAWDVAKAVMVARAQRMGFFYDRRFDCQPATSGHAQYEPKLGYLSPHTAALEIVPPGARVLDLGCAGGYVGAMLRRERGCRVTGVDRFPPGAGVELDAFVLHDLNDGLPLLDARDYDYILLLDVIEHLTSPETFVERLRDALKFAPTRPIQLRQARHPRSHALPPVHLRVVPASLRAGRLPRAADARYSGADCARAAAGRAQPCAERHQSGADSPRARPLLLSDLLRRRSASIARVPPAAGAHAIGGALRGGRGRDGRHPLTTQSA